ncbi:hypothetical protein MMC16_002723 [Acarospora aff. strigata]|nr:hypothetical protein [Acarospora aff. strigata]
MSRGMGGSSRSLPAVATTTKLNIISNATIQPHDSAESGQHAEPEQRSTTTNSGKIPGIGEEAKSAEALAKFEPTSQDVATGVQPAPQHPDSVVFQSAGPMTDQSSWLGWFSKNGSRPAAENSPQLQDSARDACQPSLDKPSQVEDHEPAAQQSKPKGIDPDLLSRSGTAKSSSQAKSWFSLWNSAAAVGDMVHPVLAPAMPKPPAPVVVPHEETLPKQVEVQAKDQTNEMQNAATPTTSAVRVPGWAFWSRDNTKTPGESQASRAETGELAVADTPSQISPKAATVEGVARLGKRERPKSPDIKDQASSGSEPGLKTKFASGATTSKTGLTELVAAKSLQESSPNLVLPLFECTYRRQETHTLLQQLGSLLRYKKSTVNRHVQIDRDPPRIKRALAIGVHGYFPAPLIRTVLGQPTGTSIRFATSAATAIDTWTKSHGYSCEIEKIALEGEGKISERVDLLWKLLLNWLEVIRKADFILLACHSQGVPVTMMLIGKLIALGCVDSARIGVCAMAGVNLGPFGDYKSRWIGGSAGELFDFARPDSSVSKDYVAALEKNLRFGVRIVYIGSIDDQLVSLEVRQTLLKDFAAGMLIARD